MELALVILAAYLIGSIPFGLILTKAAGLGDIRAIGSGNIGATNVLRTGNKKLAALTLLLDGLKGWLAIILTELFFADKISFECMETPDCTIDLAGTSVSVYAMAALAVVVGHMHPVWLKFKGGKGVATTIGAAFGLCWMLGAFISATWLLVAFIFRFSSLAALLAIAAMPLYAWLLQHVQTSLPVSHFTHDYMGFIAPLAVVAVLVWIRHHENIRRLLKGTEPKIGQKK